MGDTPEMERKRRIAEDALFRYERYTRLIPVWGILISCVGAIAAFIALALMLQ